MLRNWHEIANLDFIRVFLAKLTQFRIPNQK